MTTTLGQVPRQYEVTRDRNHYRHVDWLDDNWSKTWEPQYGVIEVLADCDKHTIWVEPKVLKTADTIPCSTCAQKDREREAAKEAASSRHRERARLRQRRVRAEAKQAKEAV